MSAHVFCVVSFTELWLVVIFKGERFQGCICWKLEKYAYNGEGRINPTKNL